MLNNIIIAYSLTKGGKGLNITQTEDFTARGFNYLIKTDGSVERFIKGHSKYFYKNIPVLHSLDGNSLILLVLGGMNKEDQVEDTTTWKQWDTLEVIINYNKLMNPDIKIYGLDQLNEEYMLPVSIPKYLSTLCI